MDFGCAKGFTAGQTGMGRGREVALCQQMSLRDKHMCLPLWMSLRYRHMLQIDTITWD